MAHATTLQCVSDYDSSRHGKHSTRSSVLVHGRFPHFSTINGSSNGLGPVAVASQGLLPQKSQGTTFAGGDTWQWQQSLQRSRQQSSFCLPFPPLGDFSRVQNPSQDDASMIGHGLAAADIFSAYPLPTTEFSHQYEQADNLGSDCLDVQRFTGQAAMEHTSWPAWTALNPVDLPYNIASKLSDPEEKYPSPQSYKDMWSGVEHIQFTTELAAERVSTSNDMTEAHNMSFPITEKPSWSDPLGDPSESFWPTGLLRNTSGCSGRGRPQLAQHSDVGVARILGNDIQTRQDLYTGTDFKTTSNTLLPTSPKGHTQASPAPPQGANGAQTASTVSKRANLGTSGSVSAPVIPHNASWGRTRHIMPALSQTRARLQSTLPMDTHALRENDDKILLEGKRNGLTYKEIGKRMHKQCAESTLRGRYRSLTKARKDRVRKPVWKQVDIDLLDERVQEDLERIAMNHPSLNYEQQLSKVQWKNVASYIEANGGTYHFGNSTCKRKWMELHPGS